MSELTTIVPGSVIDYSGLSWVALGEEQGGILVIAKEPIGNMPFDKGNRNDWRVSSLRTYLNGEFLQKIGTNGLIKFTSDLTADNGQKDYGTSEDYVALLTCDLYRKYRDLIPDYDCWWWTLTPLTANPSNGLSVRIVNGGALYHSSAYRSCGAVPCLIIDPSTYQRLRCADETRPTNADRLLDAPVEVATVLLDLFAAVEGYEHTVDTDTWTLIYDWLKAPEGTTLEAAHGK